MWPEECMNASLYSISPCGENTAPQRSALWLKSQNWQLGEAHKYTVHPNGKYLERFELVPLYISTNITLYLCSASKPLSSVNEQFQWCVKVSVGSFVPVSLFHVSPFLLLHLFSLISLILYFYLFFTPSLTHSVSNEYENLFSSSPSLPPSCSQTSV